MNFDLKLVYNVTGKPQAVFNAITDVDQVAEWSQAATEIEPKVGGKFAMFDGWTTGKVLLYDPDKLRFAVTWHSAEEPVDEVETKVSFAVVEEEQQTYLLIEHSGIVSAKSAANYQTGWLEYYIEPLMEYLDE